MQADTTRVEGAACARRELDVDWLTGLVQSYNGQLGSLMSILQEVQAKHGYLSQTALRTVSSLTGHPLVDVYSLATFYRAFSTVPRGRHVVSVCQGTACHIRGAARPLEELQRQLGIRTGQTTPDGQFYLETVNCLGACALGPVVVVDGTYHSRVDGARAKHIVDQLRQDKAAPTRATT